MVKLDDLAGVVWKAGRGLARVDEAQRSAVLVHRLRTPAPVAALLHVLCRCV